MLSPSLFTGFNYLFGSIAVLLILARFGTIAATISGLIISSYTFILFGHPFAMIWLTLEPVFIGLFQILGRPKNLILYNTLYWPLIGGPILATVFQFIMHVPWTGTIAAALMFWFIGITNSLVATLLLQNHKFSIWLGMDYSHRGIPLRQILFNMLMVVIVLPSIAVMVLNGRANQNANHATVAEQLDHLSNLINLQLTNSLKEALQSLTFVDHTLYDHNDDETTFTESFMQGDNRHTLPFKFLDLISLQGTVRRLFGPLPNPDDEVTFPGDETLNPNREQTFGVLWHQPNQLIVLRHRLMRDGKYSGNISAGIDPAILFTDLTLTGDKLSDHFLTLVNEDRRVIYSNRPGLKPAAMFNPVTLGTIVPIANNTIKLIPYSSTPVPLWRRAQKASLLQETQIDIVPDWRLFVETPFAPYQIALLERQAQTLGLLLSLMVTTLGLSLIFSKRLAAPISRLSHITTDLPEDIHLSYENIITPFNVDEYDQLGHNFQNMAKALRQKFRELTEAKETLEQRVEDRTLDLQVLNENLSREIAERKRFESQLVYLANHDPLTDLPNRNLLFDRLGQILCHNERYPCRLGIMLLDLDNFKMVNDTLGHSTGDLLLKQVAKRLQRCLRQTDTVSRFGGDEFVLLINSASNEDLAHIAEKILDTFSKPFAIDGHEVFVTTSIGITVFPHDGGRNETLLKNADAAMYQAKRLGRNNFQFFTEELNIKIRRRLDLETKMRKALEKNEFSLHYQPIVELKSGTICGIEALLRWQDEKGNMVSPGEFIPVLEETGLILTVGDWVLRTACHQAKIWMDSGFSSLRIAVNISALQFHRCNLPEKVKKILQATGLPATSLKLEITESLIQQDLKETAHKLAELKRMGVTLSIDDFGTGYSSLSYLARLPIDEIKIDRSFLEAIPEDENSCSLVTTIIVMAHHLGLTVVAEGVERSEQVEFLMENSCQKLQGYYFSKPLAAKECTALIQSGKRLELT